MARPWYGSPWVRIGGGMLLGLTAALALPFLIPADRFRPLLVRLIEAGTGREVQIDVLRLSLVPTVHIHAGGVRMKNPPGFPQGDAILIRSVDLGVAPRALLSRRLDVTHVAVSGVRVNVLRDPAGQTNLDLSPPPRGAPPARTAAPDVLAQAAGAGGSPLLTLARIGAVTVKKVDITVANIDPWHQRTTPLLTLRGLHGRIHLPDLNGPDWPRKLDIALDLRGAQLTMPSLSKPVRFRAGAFLVHDGVGRGTFSATLDSLHAAGTAAIARGDPASITFAVAVPELDVDRLKRLVIGAGDSASTSPAPPTPPSLLARGEVKIDRLIAAPFQATRMRGRLSVYTNTIRMDAYTLSAYDGTIQGAAALDQSTATLPLTVTVTARGINLGRMVRSIAPRAQKITGALDADLRLATALGRDPQAALTGGGTFAVRNGSFPGLDLKTTLAQMARAFQLHLPAGDTRFSYFGGDLFIAQQRARSSSLRLEGEDLEGTARGSVGFNKTLDYTGIGVLKTVTAGTSPSEGLLPSAGQLLGKVVPGAAGATGARVPFSLRGTVDDPKFSLAGTPQLIHNQSPQQPPQQPAQPQPPGLQDLFKLFR